MILLQVSGHQRCSEGGQQEATEETLAEEAAHSRGVSEDVGQQKAAVVAQW